MCFNVTVNEDQVIENEESFTLLIERDIPGVSLPQVLSQSTATIIDTSGKHSCYISLYSDIHYQRRGS